MAKTYSWSTDAEELRRLFTLTFDDLHFLEPLRADAQRLYRALVLVWARVERVLVSDPGCIPEEVITHVSRQLSLKPSVLSQLRNHPSARSATFEAVRKHLDVRAWQESDAEQLSAYLIENICYLELAAMVSLEYQTNAEGTCQRSPIPNPSSGTAIQLLQRILMASGGSKVKPS